MQHAYRLFACCVCNHEQKIGTNHHGECFDYCQSCSWKSFGFDRENTANYGGRAYRRFRFVRELSSEE